MIYSLIPLEGQSQKDQWLGQSWVPKVKSRSNSLPVEKSFGYSGNRTQRNCKFDFCLFLVSRQWISCIYDFMQSLFKGFHKIKLYQTFSTQRRQWQEMWKNIHMFTNLLLYIQLADGTDTVSSYASPTTTTTVWKYPFLGYHCDKEADWAFGHKECLMSCSF